MAQPRLQRQSRKQDQKEEKWQRESLLFVRTYDLLVWLTGRVSDFPRAHRFRLAQRIENAAFGFDERLLRATRAGTPKAEMRLLLEADVELDKLRFYIRLAAGPELRLITSRQYEHVSRMIVEVGRLLGGMTDCSRLKEYHG